MDSHNPDLLFLPVLEVSLGWSLGVSRVLFFPQALGENAHSGLCHFPEVAHILSLVASSSAFKASSGCSGLSHRVLKTWLPAASIYNESKTMATHSSTLAWQIPWMEEPGRLQSMGSLRTEWLHFYFLLSCTEEGNGNALQYSCLENPRDGGAWWAAVYGVAQSWTQLKWLSSSKCFKILLYLEMT